jgi:PKD repeat protein
LAVTNPVSVGDSVISSLETEIPQDKISKVDYKWGVSETTTDNTYVYDETGSYTVTAVITTVTGNKITEEASIEVVDSPVARFDASEVSINTPVTFDGSSSSAPSDEKLTYQWTIDGPSISQQMKTGQSVSYSFSTFDDYTVGLTVTGPDGQTDSVSKTVTVDEMDVSFTVDNPGVNVDSILNVSTSAGSKVDKYKVDWDGDGKFDDSYQTSSISHSFAESGERVITVKAVDETSGVGSSVEKNVNIYQSPSFDLYAETTQGYLSNGYLFEARGVNADDPSYTWDFNNGEVKSGASVTQVYDQVGVYNVQLTVENKYGITKTKTVEVTIESPNPYKGCTKFDSDTTFNAGTYTYDCVVVSAGTTLTAKGSPSDDGPNSYGGVKIKASGPIVVNGTIDANVQGYRGGGPGEVNYNAAGYGGRGCKRQRYCDPAGIYGDAYEANRLGSGYQAYGGTATGGGSVWLDSEEEVFINGVITADGNGDDPVSASGGSIRIESPETKGNGHLSAEGGAFTGFPSSSGGGGRILIKSPNRIYQWSISASAGSWWGVDGTVKTTS